MFYKHQQTFNKDFDVQEAKHHVDLLNLLDGCQVTLESMELTRMAFDFSTWHAPDATQNIHSEHVADITAWVWCRNKHGILNIESINRTEYFLGCEFRSIVIWI